MRGPFDLAEQLLGALVDARSLDQLIADLGARSTDALDVKDPRRRHDLARRMAFDLSVSHAVRSAGGMAFSSIR